MAQGISYYQATLTKRNEKYKLIKKISSYTVTQTSQIHFPLGVQGFNKCSFPVAVYLARGPDMEANQHFTLRVWTGLPTTPMRLPTPGHPISETIPLVSPFFADSGKAQGVWGAGRVWERRGNCVGKGGRERRGMEGSGGGNGLVTESVSRPVV